LAGSRACSAQLPHQRQRQPPWQLRRPQKPPTLAKAVAGLKAAVAVVDAVAVTPTVKLGVKAGATLDAKADVAKALVAMNAMTVARAKTARPATLKGDSATPCLKATHHKALKAMQVKINNARLATMAAHPAMTATATNAQNAALPTRKANARMAVATAQNAAAVAMIEVLNGVPNAAHHAMPTLPHPLSSIAMQLHRRV
jgi:hypothetical protein